VPEAPGGRDVKFVETALRDVYVVELEPNVDERGFFARSWCSREFAEHGMAAAFVQENVGYSTEAGTMRGLHYQEAPFAEAKLVRCTSGAVWDVAVDVRPDSATFAESVGVELNRYDQRMLYVGEGCAHGYITLTSEAEVTYLTSQFYEPDAARGLRYDDPALRIPWPVEARVVSDRDRSWPLLTEGSLRATAR
jgi:dTDP-4-dehydrorhamnose 3,5-epimerase